MNGERTAKGRFAPGNRAAVRKAKKAPGYDGVYAWAGYVSDPNEPAELAGSRKWTAYAKAFDRPPVAIRALLQHALLSSAKWTAVENEAGGADARKGAEVVEQGLLYARLPVPWGEVVAKAAMSWFFGSSLHATALGRKPDGSVVYTDIAHRPMHTIERWQRKTDSDPWTAVEQRTPSGKTATIPLAECLYLVERMLSDDPFGVGTLRLVVERIRRAGLYEKLEGSEMFSSMAGTPIARAPLEEINENARGQDDPTTYRNNKIANIKEIVANRIKTPERQMYALLDSATHPDVDGNPTGHRKWDIEILKADLQGLADIRKVISDLDLDIARIMGVEFVLVGGNDSAGTYGMHESKISMFQSTMQALLGRIADRATQQLARRLVAANGLDPDTACPYLVPEKISTTAVLDAVAALEGMNRAGLHPEDPARAVIRERLELPEEPVELLGDMRAPSARVKPEEDIEPTEEEEEDDVA